ncbi:hypothetical protein BGP77_12420 [Saccharospirillum sp. MSK14-1]|uniref:hypothetical protein n=1 Tax=Saccharospirillum sp. MSK14-1 TaxID=1897632 RepID=UPI000D360190|nr:hypothetical protein [Saccharospirillum sp. MSK14-1]PTY38504.1 hypothetical protein BGP77_12420 [Saccharospirillum sp. MSK14-1]
MSYSDYLLLLSKVAALLIFFAVTLMLVNKGKKKRQITSPQPINTATLMTPAVPKINLRFSSARNLRFQWRDVDGASHYQLLERIDGQAEFKLVGPYILPGRESLVWTTPLYCRLNAQYVLRAFNEQGFTDSPLISVSTELTETINYLKSTDIEICEYFGFAVHLNDRNNILAIAEDDFSSAHPKKHGTTASSYTGAAFIFRRIDSGQWAQSAYVNALAKADVCDDDDNHSSDLQIGSTSSIKDGIDTKKQALSGPAPEIFFRQLGWISAK